MVQQILMKLVALWFAFSLGTLAATVSPSVLPAENTKLTPASSAIGPVYREARDFNAYESGGYNYRSYDRPQQSRCISCLYDMSSNQNRDRPGYSPGLPTYGPQRENEDRNWYYQSDERNRNTQYENRYPQQNRYDYRPAGGYDRNDQRQMYQDYRGNGYDNRDPIYNSMRGNNRGYGNRDASYESNYDDRMSNRGYSSTAGYSGNSYYMRPSYQNSAYDQDRYYGQGRPYERPERPEYYDKNMGYGGSNGYGGNRGGSTTNGYEDVNFRPWDQTYRGISGFDSQGHGHYYSNSQTPSLPQNHQHQQAPPRPFQQQGVPHESSSGHSQHTYGSDAMSGTGSSGSSTSGKGSYGGNWNYINSNDRNNQHHGHQGYGQTQDKESQSSPYGERPGQRPLSTSYLHERETPTVISGDSSSDTNINPNQTKQPKVTTTTSNDNENTKTNSTDKINNINTYKNLGDEANTVSTTSKDITDQ